MTVERMINVLKTMDPKAEVRLHGRFGEPVLFVVALNFGEGGVWLETESDNDMTSEIEARFENAAEKQLDELDFYMDMLETGIDVSMVRKYMDNETADHMLEFCRDHGLIDESPKLSFSWDRFPKGMFELAQQNITSGDEEFCAVIHVGSICIDCTTRPYDDGMRLDYDLYVYGENTGYGFTDSGVPYDYADGGSFDAGILHMTYEEFKAYAEKVLTDFIVENDGKKTYSLLEHAKDKLVVW